MTTRSIKSHDNKWFTEYVTDIWKGKPSCRSDPDLPWTADTAPAGRERAIMAKICAGCPLLLGCAEYAITTRDRRGVEGGFYAGVWIPWKNESGGMSIESRKIKAESRTTLRRLLRGAAHAETARLAAVDDEAMLVVDIS